MTVTSSSRQASRRRATRLTALLLATVSMTGVGAWSVPAMAQVSATRAFDIPAQPLDSALHALMAQTGIELAYGSVLSQGKRSSAVSGEMSPVAALSRLLAGTGLSYRQTGPRSFTLEPAPTADAGTVQLGTLRVEGAGEGGSDGPVRPGWDGSADTVYSTAGSLSTISRETLERFPGTSPVDMLKSAPGVLSGEPRASGGIDVNIRGLQGQGRVAVTVDGTINGSTVYRGYQGVGNRTFVDRDFIGGVSIEKGPATGPGGAGAIGGTVAMTTIKATDIVPEGSSVALRVKSSVWGNTSPYSTSGLRSGLENNRSFIGDTDRPNLLEPTAGSASIVFGAKTDRFDLIAGVSHRRSGDYHVGEEGGAAPERGLPSTFCINNPAAAQCVGVTWYEGPGLTRFVGGERVLNTSQDTKSALLKATFRIGDSHAVELGYSKYLSRFGENYPTDTAANTTTVYQGILSSSDLDRYSLRYSFDPESDLVDLKFNAWATNLQEASQALGGWSSAPKFIEMRGADIANTSRLVTGLGELVAEYGLSYMTEETGPESGVWNGIPAREGAREEVSLFARGSWVATDWLQVDGGLRYQSYSLDDALALPTDPERSEDGFGWSLGVTAEPIDGFQLFASYKDALRLPSLLEGTRGFFLSADPALEGERSHSWEVGANLSRKSIFRDGDKLGAKLVYFDTDIENYISRRYDTTFYAMWIYNIDRARFAGIEGSLSYSIGDFTAELSATKYTDILFCREGESCLESSLAADYATNQVPPGFASSVTLTQTLFDDRLTISGRMNYVGERAAKFETTLSGAQPFIRAIPWEAYTTGDLFVGFKLNKAVTFEASVENITDEYYVEPLSLGRVPAPGRTVRVGITSLLAPGALSSGESFWTFGQDRTEGRYDWTGFHGGVHAGFSNGSNSLSDFTYTIDGGAGARSRIDMGDGKGGLIGFQGGYTYQLNDMFAVGVEATYDQAGVKASVEQYSGSNAWLETDRIVTARVRAAVVQDRLMGYVAAGWAQADIAYDLNRDGILFADSGEAKGYTVAAGVEYAIGSSLSLRAEYSFLDLAGETLHAATPAFGLLFENTTKPRLQTDQLTLGVNFRF